MTSVRKISTTPSFSLLTQPKEIKTAVQEISKLSPLAEVSIEGLTELATGVVTEWQEKRNFFTVEWKKKSAKFSTKTESQSGLRVFFKLQLFSTQIVFKSTTLRRVNERFSHFRIPEQLYQQQRRGALRVPIFGTNAFIVTPQGEFPLVNLSVAGARAAHGGYDTHGEHGTSKDRTTGKSKISPLFLNVILDPCTLVLGRRRISNPNFGVRVTHLDESGVGLLFHGLTATDKILMKQFLVEALHLYFKTKNGSMKRTGAS